MYNAKNYTEPGGDVTHIGGTLIIDEGGSVLGLPSFNPCQSQEASNATSVAALKDDFNALLEKLKTAGIMLNG